MSFWSAAKERELKQKFRWYITMGGNNDKTIWRFYAKSVEIPSYDIKTTTAKLLYSHEFKFPNRVSWKPITLCFYDFYDGKSTADLLHDKLIMSGTTDGYLPPEKLDGSNILNQYHFKDSMKSKIDPLQIHEIGTDGKSKEYWTLGNPFISSANYDKLDYSEEAAMLVTITVSYDWATLTKG
jgi:hypothetical protein